VTREQVEALTERIDALAKELRETNRQLGALRDVVARLLAENGSAIRVVSGERYPRRRDV
jgi:phosphate uptake regulator